MPVEQTRCGEEAVASLATVYAGAAPGANTNILATSVKVSAHASAIRVTVCLTTSSVFNVQTTDGTTAYVNGLNASVALNAGDVYTFTFGARRYKSQPYTDGTTAELSYNFQVETDSVIRFLFVDEVIGPVI